MGFTDEYTQMVFNEVISLQMCLYKNTISTADGLPYTLYLLMDRPSSSSTVVNLYMYAFLFTLPAGTGHPFIKAFCCVGLYV